MHPHTKSHNPLFRYAAKYPAAGVFFLLLLGLENVFGRYFPNYLGYVGHDFQYMNPALLDGAFWFWKNGLFSIPWFTPSFCGGQPFFADPQSAYFSPLQWLAFVFPPTQAAHVGMLLSCSVGYWAFYFLTRRVFLMSTSAAIVAGALAMFNGFTPHRFLVGETYQTLLYSAFVAHALLSVEMWGPGKKSGIGNAFWAGIAMAFMLQSGLTTLMIPVGLSIVAVACVAKIVGKGVSFPVFLWRGTLACLFSVALCISKVLASLTYMSHFPRTAYALPGFIEMKHAMLAPLLSLVLDSQTLWAWSGPLLTNVQWVVFPHEWAYQFGWVYAVLIIFGVCCWLQGLRKQNLQVSTTSELYQQAAYVMLLIVILLIPSALLWYDPRWNAVLKTVPIVNTTSFPFRWIIIWIPVACIAGAAAWQAAERQINNSDIVKITLVIFCAAILIESGVTNRDYYIDQTVQNYNPEWIDRAWQEGKEGKIRSVAVMTDDISVPGNQGRNDAIVAGGSFIHCYNPVYGYRLETFPVGRLQSGVPALTEQNGYLNVKKPACLIWPKENNCAVLGDEYTAPEKAQAGQFLERKPIEFNVSSAQRISHIINVLALIFAAFGLCVFIYERMKLR
jgi:hypothetical protein